MSTASPSVRQRGKKQQQQPQQLQQQRAVTPTTPDSAQDSVEDLSLQSQIRVKETVGSQWDYKLAIGIITILAFVTRFWGITHPDQVVFDEVHFGKVCDGACYIMTGRIHY